MNTFTPKQKVFFGLNNWKATTFLITKWMLLLLFVPKLSVAQRDLEKQKALEDYTIFKNILYRGHPALHAYISNDSLETLFYTHENHIANQKLTDLELFKKLQTIVTEIKDANLQLWPPVSLQMEHHLFPVILKIIKKEFYTDTADFGIPIGSKITQINGQKLSRVLENLKRYVSSDGNNQTKKYREIEQNFSKFFAYEYGVANTYQVTYKTGDSIKVIAIAGESLAKIQIRATKRSSYFASYHKHKNSIYFFEKYIYKKKPFLYQMPNLHTAVLVINTFRIDRKLFKSRLEALFATIKSQSIKNLIIDVRNNTGGYRHNAILLYSYLTQSPFKQRASEFVATLEIPERERSIHFALEEEQYLKMKFYTHPERDGWKITYDEMETLMRPHHNAYQGKTYVLVGGGTCKEASTFALCAKNNPKILLIGNDTAGGYYFHNSEFPVYYKLPNSGIRMQMHLTKIEHLVPNPLPPKGAAVAPDRYIRLSISDLKNGKDAALDYILRLIKGRAPSH